MLGMGDMRELVEKVQDLKLDQNKNLMKNLEAGKKFKPGFAILAVSNGFRSILFTRHV